VPAAAVIPAPEASTEIAAVKRFVVGQGNRGESRGLKRGIEGTGQGLRGAVEGRGIWQLEVKFGDLPRTNRGEGACQGSFH
jgi:hypothetical protein